MPEEAREHIASNWQALCFEPIVKHFAGLSDLRAADVGQTVSSSGSPSASLSG